MATAFVQLELFAGSSTARVDDAPSATGTQRTFYLGPAARASSPYLHLVRASDDPERSPRGPGRALLWRSLDKHTAEAWAARIVEHLSDGTPRTFNRIMVELSDFTADVAFESTADDGLWLAVTRHQLALTHDAPVLFTCSDCLAPGP